MACLGQAAGYYLRISDLLAKLVFVAVSALEKAVVKVAGERSSLIWEFSPTAWSSLVSEIFDLRRLHINLLVLLGLGLQRWWWYCCVFFFFGLHWFSCNTFHACFRNRTLVSAKNSSQFIMKFHEGTLLHLHQQGFGYRHTVAVIQLACIVLLQCCVEIDSKVRLLDNHLASEYL